MQHDGLTGLNMMYVIILMKVISKKNWTIKFYSILIVFCSTTSHQNSFNALWHRFNKCLELHMFFGGPHTAKQG